MLRSKARWASSALGAEQTSCTARRAARLGEFGIDVRSMASRLAEQVNAAGRAVPHVSRSRLPEAHCPDLSNQAQARIASARSGLELRCYQAKWTPCGVW